LEKGNKNKNLKADDILRKYVQGEDSQTQINVKNAGQPSQKSNKETGKTDSSTHLWSRAIDSAMVIEDIGDKDKISANQKSSEQKDKKQTGDNKNSTGKGDGLLEGLSFDNLKKKYKKNMDPEFKKNEIEKFDEENENALYKELEKYNIVTTDMNEDEFQEEKEKLYEENIPQELKTLKGWGAWAGIGIAQPKVNKEAELKKKKEKIEKLKKQRADGKLDNVIIHEERNKLVTKYLVSDLPHPYKSSEQFDYLQNLPLGPEWNTLKNHQKLIRPKIVTKAGSIIKPIQPPKIKTKLQT